MSATVSDNRPSPQAADIAAMIRNRLNRPPPPLPRADAALLKATAVILLAGLAITGLALYGPRLSRETTPAATTARIGEAVLSISQDLIGPDHDEGGRVVGMARLRLDWPSFGPVTGQSRQKLLITLSPQDKVNEPATQLSVYARFLTPMVWSNPGGLVVRGFRKGSPYENDELYVSLPDGRGFAARCPVETGVAGFEEPCRVTFRHRGLDVNIRFPRAIIADWDLMIGGARRAVDGLLR